LREFQITDSKLQIEDTAALGKRPPQRRRVRKGFESTEQDVSTYLLRITLFSALRSLRLCGESSFVLPERYAHKIEKGENRPHPFLDIIALFARRQC
jgi:hypothetical protein